MRPHGGTVSYQPSKPLGGACVIITLPNQTDTPDRPEADARDAKSNRQTKKDTPLPALRTDIARPMECVLIHALQATLPDDETKRNTSGSGAS